jgi:hypothetical protein
MARYEALTKLTPEKAIEKAAKHFATVSGGLAVSSKTGNSLCLEGPDGYVTISICPSDKRGKKNVMEIETSQFDEQVRSFMRSL